MVKHPKWESVRISPSKSVEVHYENKALRHSGKNAYIAEVIQQRAWRGSQTLSSKYFKTKKEAMKYARKRAKQEWQAMKAKR
jgi:hypothetical protein